MVQSAHLERNHQVSRLVLGANAPLEFQVELADPQTVILHLPGSRLDTPLPPTAGDPVISAIRLRPEPGGVALEIRTRSPGVTVLPLYQAAARRLTLELGGAATLEKTVSPPPARPKQVAPPPPKPAPKAVSRAPAPVRPGGPPPAVAGIHLGAHPGFTRLVLQADRTVFPTLERRGHALILRLARGMLLPGVKPPAPAGVVEKIEIVRRSPLELRIQLARPLAGHRLFGLEGDNTAVLDLRPAAARPVRAAARAARVTKAIPPAEKPAAPLAPGAGPKQPDTRMLTRDLGNLEPNRLPPGPRPPAPGPKAQKQAPPGPEEPALVSRARVDKKRARGVIPLPPATTQAPEPAPVKQAKVPSTPDRPLSARTAAPAAKPAPEKAASRRRPSPPPLDLALVSRARVARERPLARGKIPPVPPPSPLAHPRGKIPLPRDTGPPSGPQEVIARIKQAKQAATPASGPPPVDLPNAPAAQTGTAPRRFPQAARLGPLGRREAEGRTVFERAQELLDRRRYQQAYRAFESFLKRFPKHPLAAEATFRAADAFFYLHERNILPVYPEVMEKYQRAVDLYPKSDQVPWAFLQMGKAAMLAQEPFRAQGYFQLVIEDYPKSEYVPLAMVSRARTYVAEGKWVKALEEFRAVSERFPDSRFRKDADWGQAQALFGLARYYRASLLLKDMDRRYPKLRLQEPELLYYIGEAEFQMKNYAQARAYFLWALNLMPDIRDNDIILTRVGDTYQFEKAYAAAKVIYNQVVKLFPGTDGALVARIRLAESPQKDKDNPWDIFQVAPTTTAYETYREIAREYPNRPVGELARLKLAVYYYKKKKYYRTIKSLEELLRVHPRTNFKPEIEYTMNLAVLGLLDNLRAQGDALGLMDTYLRYRALLTRPNSNKILTMLAWAYERTGLSGRAARLYQVLISRGLDKPALYLGLASNLMQDRRYQEVVKALDPKVIAKFKGADAVEAQSMRGRALARLGRCQEASQVLGRLLGETSEYPWAARDYFTLGRCQSRLGNYKRALAAFSMAQDLMPDDAKPLQRYLLHMEAGWAARKAGQARKALQHFETARSLAQGKSDQAQALYEVAQSLRRLKRHHQVARSFQELAKMQVSPWSQMAQRHLADMKLAPELAQVGK